MTLHVNPSALSTSGVWGTSTPAAFQSYVIFCVGNDKWREAAFRCWASAHGMSFKSLVGCYKGIQEASFLMAEDDALKAQQWWRDEESILALSPLYMDGRKLGSRRAMLIFKNDSTQDLGFFSQVGRDYALKQDAWTFDPETGTYWVAGE